MRKTRSRAPRGPAAVSGESARPRSHAVLAQLCSSAFMDLGISSSLFHGGDDWEPLYVSGVPDAVMFELAHGVDTQRKAHNASSTNRARTEGKPLVTVHAGFHDLFMPVGRGASYGTLVTGPFALARVTSAELGTRWRWLTGRHARLSDPEFVRYLTVTLATPMFEGASLTAFKRLHECLALALSGEADLVAIGRELGGLRKILSEVRHVEQMWTVARGMLDEGTWREWLGSYRVYPLRGLGLRRLPEHVLVGLLSSRRPDRDPIDEHLARDALLRAGAVWARQRGALVCGRVGDHGVVLLFDESSASRVRGKALELSEKMASLGRRFGFRLHFGASVPAQPFVLPERYRAALSAAEQALSRRVALVFAERNSTASSRLGDLRRELSRAVASDPRLLGPRFERYLEAALAHRAYGVEVARADLEAGFDHALHALRSANVLDEKSFAELWASIQSSAAEASTVGELSTVYRRAMANVELALQRPIEARQERSLGRAIAHVRDHFAEQLSLQGVARIAGFAPGYFSKLFVHSERMTFREFVQRLRIERAKQLLATTTLSSNDVGQLCGFRSRHRFHAVFRKLEGETPGAYRAHAGKS